MNKLEGKVCGVVLLGTCTRETQSSAFKLLKWASCKIPRAPSIQILPTLGPKVYKYDLFGLI